MYMRVNVYCFMLCTPLVVLILCKEFIFVSWTPSLHHYSSSEFLTWCRNFATVLVLYVRSCAKPFSLEKENIFYTPYSAVLWDRQTIRFMALCTSSALCKVVWLTGCFKVLQLSCWNVVSFLLVLLHGA